MYTYENLTVDAAGSGKTDKKTLIYFDDRGNYAKSEFVP